MEIAAVIIIGSIIVVFIIIRTVILLTKIGHELKEINTDVEKNIIEYREKFFADGFNMDRAISYSCYDIFIDATKRKFAFINYYGFFKYYDFNNVVDCEIIEDNSTIMKGGVGRAVVGGVLAGGVGAIVGASTRSSSDIVRMLEVKIVLDDIVEPVLTMKLILSETERDTITYREALSFAHETHAAMVSMISSSKKDEVSKVNVVEGIEETATGKIKELAKLKDEGILTEEEFTAKKTELLAKM
jgi:hypothetical protein